MVQADAGQANHPAIGVEGGGIEATAQAHLQDRQLHSFGRKAIKGGGREQFKGGEVEGTSDRTPAAQVGAQLGGGDPALAQLQALTPAQQMGGAVDAVVQTRLRQDRRQERADRSLAVGARHLHGGEAPLRMAPGRQGPGQPIEAEVDAAAGKGFEQIA